MAQDLLATVTFEHVSGIPEDRVVTTFPLRWFGAGSPAAADFDAAVGNLDQFFNAANTTSPISLLLSDELSRAAGASLVRFYDLTGHLDGSAHGSPVHSQGFTLGVGSGDLNLPGEVAVVLTTRAEGWESAPVEQPDGADPGALVDRPRQRLSGRNFIGPLKSGAVSNVGTTARVTSAFRTDLLDAGEALQTEMVADNFVWSVWSRVNGILEPITHLQVDDAFDTMRKRGPDPTNRTTRLVFVP